MPGAARPIDRCRGCHGSDLRAVFEMEPMPLAGEFSISAEAARDATIYPLSLVRCPLCGLVQVLEDIPDELLFGRYNYASSTVPGLVRHFEDFARDLAQRHGASPLALLEIGCNDGVLLRRLPARWRLVGVDPSDVARNVPAGPYELLNQPFGSEAAAALASRGRFDVVTASNSLAHTTDIRDLLIGAHLALRDGGSFYVEVHDLDAATRGGQWDVIYHEHKVEWSERSLASCVTALGFALERVDRLPLHGGLLRARFRKTGAVSGPFPPGPEPALARLAAAYRGRRETDVYRRLSKALADGVRVAGYGASGRANVWLNQLPELTLAYVVDDSPLRANKWLPHVAIPIVGARELERNPPEICVVTAWNYLDDIRRRNPRYAGEWIPTFSG